jgi:hypothetical protein
MLLIFAVSLLLIGHAFGRRRRAGRTA